MPCPTRPARMTPSLGRSVGGGGMPERARACARISCGHLLVTVASWDKNTLGRLLFAHWRMCVKGSRKNRQWRRHRTKRSTNVPATSTFTRNYPPFRPRGYYLKSSRKGRSFINFNFPLDASSPVLSGRFPKYRYSSKAPTGIGAYKYQLYTS